ncbi:MAG: T9SS type A sorting domain-containing protein, partial [Bacteroidota bacterium]
LEVVQVTPSATGLYLFQVVNKSSTVADFSLYQVVTLGTSPSLLTGVDDDPAGTKPTVFSLSQNYPNPFNPTTSIAYSLPEAGYVVLKIFNVLGNEMITIQEGYQQAGTYRRSFEGNALPSGVYLCRLEFSDQKGHRMTRINRMVLLK